MISIVGIGPGGRGTVTPEALGAVRQADCLIGAQRALKCFDDLDKPKLASVRLEEIVAYLASHPDYKNPAVVMSGDVGFYSGAKKLAAALTGKEVRLICGISSLQYFCAKLRTPWEDVHVLSLHGREEELVHAVLHHPKTFVLCGGKNTVQSVCARLCAADLGELSVWAGENLSYPEERIVPGTAQELAGGTFGDLSVVLVVSGALGVAGYTTPGLEDERFLRGEVPMTKSEVRAVILSKLRLRQTDTVYDIGAGTGSVSIEIAQRTGGAVFAVEREAAAAELVRQNRQRFDALNLTVIEGEAPAALLPLPPPARAFIGGTGGKMEEILSVLRQKNPAVRVVASAITLETVSRTLAAFASLGFGEPEIVQLSIAKAQKAGESHMLLAQNPVFLLCAQGSTRR